MDEYDPTTRQRRRRRIVRAIALVLVVLLAVPILVEAIGIAVSMIGS